MPELPEVETVRRGLEPVLAGRTLVDVRISDSRLTRPHDPLAVAMRLCGNRIVAVDRRGKYLIVRFESGGALVIHLRMTGSLRSAPDGSLPDDTHRRAVVTLDNGSAVAYRDVRRFGTWDLFEPGAVEQYLDDRLGPEPLSGRFTTAVFARALARRRAPIKSVILDQKTVAGVGNIYADEALWRAKIHPLREAAALTDVEVATLRRTIRAALQRGVELQGSTLRDYALPDGEYGGMQNEFKAYGREGEPCARCRTPIEKIKVGGRGTWYCPRCQRSPREAV
ncbi:MAG: DNA-formamidopyrimidine glycosylase [Actinobacteria bacterium]|uniref:Unannotated protein n=1 Tax=freshwater metagenome TaxID=449393 RepID=A0A6J6P479_9ZZZZ|nr:DNA-formamidopyrimidine glycosylase [Actinomycetota bacterium]